MFPYSIHQTDDTGCFNLRTFFSPLMSPKNHTRNISLFLPFSIKVKVMFTFSPMGYEKWLSITLSSFMFFIITLSICSDVLKWIKMIGLKALKSCNILYMYNIGLIALSSDKPQAKTFNYIMTKEWKVCWVELSMAVLSIPFFVSFLLIYVNPWLNQTSNHSKLVIYLILVWRAAVLSPRFNDLHVVYIYIVLPTTIMCNMRDNIVFPRDLPVRPYTIR